MEENWKAAMETVAERTSEGIIYKCRRQVAVPNVDLLTFLFEYPNEGLKEDTLLHVDAADPSKFVTLASQRDILKRVAHTLRFRYGIGNSGPRTDVVHLLTLGHFMLPTVFYGVVAAGGSISTSLPTVTPAELARQLQLTQSKLLICTSELKSLGLAAANIARLPLEKVLFLGHNHKFELFEVQSPQKAIQISNDMLEWRRITDQEELANTVTTFIYSSGTTGLPKAVCLTHMNLVSNAVLLLDQPKEWVKRNNRPKARTIAHLPTAHIAGLQGYFVHPAYMGGTVYWMPRFDFPLFLKYLKTHQITQFFSVPPIWLAIAKSPLVTDQLDSVELGMSGAAPLGKEIQAAAAKKLARGNGTISQTWGLSETTGGFTYMPRGLECKTGSVAMIIPGCEARIVNEEGKDVEPGQAGEIWVRGPIVFREYYKNERATDEAFVNDWFCTGDICLFKDGKIYYVDRKKELIKYKGHQVAPAELEALLLTNPKVQDAAVIGVEGEDTEVPRAYVVADPNKTTAEEIMRWVTRNAGKEKWLRGGVVFVEAIPKSAAGKILRKELRELAKREGKARL